MTELTITFEDNNSKDINEGRNIGSFPVKTEVSEVDGNVQWETGCY